MFLFISCNSEIKFKNEVLINISKYESSAIELAGQFGNLATLSQLSDTTFHSAQIYSAQRMQSENIIERKELQLDKTKKLRIDKLAESIFLNSDTTIYYNTYNSESSLTKSYRHFLCFTSHQTAIRFDMINNAYKILTTKNIDQYWTYITIEQGFD